MAAGGGIGISGAGGVITLSSYRRSKMALRWRKRRAAASAMALLAYRASHGASSLGAENCRRQNGSALRHRASAQRRNQRGISGAGARLAKHQLGQRNISWRGVSCSVAAALAALSISWRRRRGAAKIKCGVKIMKNEDMVQRGGENWQQA
jgi:hypothetical protein